MLEWLEGWRNIINDVLRVTQPSQYFLFLQKTVEEFSLSYDMSKTVKDTKH